MQEIHEFEVTLSFQARSCPQTENTKGVTVTGRSESTEPYALLQTLPLYSVTWHKMNSSNLGSFVFCL